MRWTPCASIPSFFCKPHTPHSQIEFILQLALEQVLYVDNACLVHNLCMLLLSPSGHRVLKVHCHNITFFYSLWTLVASKYLSIDYRKFSISWTSHLPTYLIGISTSTFIGGVALMLSTPLATVFLQGAQMLLVFSRPVWNSSTWVFSDLMEFMTTIWNSSRLWRCATTSWLRSPIHPPRSPTSFIVWSNISKRSFISMTAISPTLDSLWRWASQQTSPCCSFFSSHRGLAPSPFGHHEWASTSFLSNNAITP